MNAISLRNIDDKTYAKLKILAKSKSMSINKLIIMLLKDKLGLNKDALFETNHDLDYLFGAWSKEDKNKFDSITKNQRKVDKDLWK